jgi:hypothetical protein
MVTTLRSILCGRLANDSDDSDYAPLVFATVRGPLARVKVWTDDHWSSVPGRLGYVAVRTITVEREGAPCVTFTDEADLRDCPALARHDSGSLVLSSDPAATYVVVADWALDRAAAVQAAAVQAA